MLAATVVALVVLIAAARSDAAGDGSDSVHGASLVVGVPR
jgi:hypothetical protein